jgi:iron complex transport system substrate-binding protein
MTTAAVLSAALIGGVIGCGQASPGTASPPQAASPAPAQTAPAPQSAPKERTVTHDLGQAVIPTEPKRIAVTQQILVDWLYPLGFHVSVSPKASPNQDFAPYTPADQQKDIKLIGPPGNPNLEAYLAENPDLIVINNNHDKAYEQLSKIAPSIYLTPKEDWRENLRDYGKLFAREAQAEKWLQDYKKKADSAKTELASTVGKESVIFIRFLPKELRVYSNHPTSSVGGVLYSDLGLQPIAGLASDKYYEAISLETLVAANPDHIFMQIGFIPESDEQARKTYEDITKGPLWAKMTAVQKGQIYMVDDNFFNNSPMGKAYVIDTALQTFAKKANQPK